MFAANASRSRLGVRHALAGLHAGILGALVMLGCLMLGSMLDRRSVWLVPNLFATTFFGGNAYANEYAHGSWAGVALILAIYGAFGAIWGCLWRDQRRPGLALYGGILGLAVYFLFFDLVWKHVNPLITLYAPDRQLELGHVLWGMILARSPRYSREITERLMEHQAQETPVLAEPGGSEAGVEEEGSASRYNA
jgi:hypothetical protein